MRSSGLVRNVNYDWAEKSKELRIVVDVEPLITRLSAWATRAIAMQVTTSRSCAGVAAGRSVPTSRGG